MTLSCVCAVVRSPGNVKMKKPQLDEPGLKVFKMESNRNKIKRKVVIAVAGCCTTGGLIKNEWKHCVFATLLNLMVCFWVVSSISAMICE